jgi:hypothetical protein
MKLPFVGGSVAVDEFPAIFIGGVGTNGQIKETWVRVRVLANKETEYKFIGKLFAGWNKCIHDLTNEEKFPYALRDVMLGSECKIFRVYYHSLKLEPYMQSIEQSSLKIVNHRLKLQLMEAKEMLASAQKQLHDFNYDDRKRKADMDKSKHDKALRSNLMYHEQVGFGMQ